MISIT
jgi:hypothetical protein